MTRSNFWPPAGSIQYPPNERAWRFGQPTSSGGGGGGGAYNYAALFTGGKNGLYIDGLASDFLQSEGGAVSGDGDALGYIEDLSGNGKNMLQTTGGSKPTTDVDANNIKSAYFYPQKWMAATLASAINTTTDNMSAIVIFSKTGGGNAYPWMMYNSGGNTWIENGASDGLRTSLGQITCAQQDTGPYIARVQWLAGGSQTIWVYDMTGTQLATGQRLIAVNQDLKDIVQISYGGEPYGGWVCFQLTIADNIDDTKFDLIKADLVSRFGAWSPS